MCLKRGSWPDLALLLPSTLPSQQVPNTHFSHPSPLVPFSPCTLYSFSLSLTHPCAIPNHLFLEDLSLNAITSRPSLHTRCKSPASWQFQDHVHHRLLCMCHTYTHRKDDLCSMNFISCPAPTLTPLHIQLPILDTGTFGRSDPSRTYE